MLLNTVFVNTVEEMPALNKETLCIVGLPGNEWLGVMLCPCNCGAKIQLNLLKTERPAWTQKTITNRTTITPSVNRIVGCKSHFWVREGKIVWCNR